MARTCPIHTDVLMIERPSGSVNGGMVRYGCAICNMLEIDRLRRELDVVTGNNQKTVESIQRFRDRDAPTTTSETKP